MKNMISFLICFLIMGFTACSQQTPSSNNTKLIGGGCDGCEAIYAGNADFKYLHWADTLPDFNEPGPKLVITGVIYKKDGKTPARDVILYVYHTDQTGHYTNKTNEAGAAGRHGYIKGWMKTNEKGEYKFYTLMPGNYPGGDAPAHIHPIIKEPGINEYYIDEYLFEGDPALTNDEKNKQEKRGGSGIISPEIKDEILYGKRDIILGFNIPGYPTGN